MKINFSGIFIILIIITSVAISTLFIPTPVLADSGIIPDWVKTVVQYWLNGLVTDEEIIYMMHYLTINNIVTYDDKIETHLKILRQLPDFIEHETKELDDISQSPTIMSFLKASNKEFSNLPNSQKIIEMREAKWDTGNPYMTPFTSDLLTNEASTSLIDFMNAEIAEGDLFRQISLTNVHGVNIAMTSRFDDYVQSDEGWWMITVSDGKYASTLEYNLQLDKHGTFIAKKITDENGQFVGIIHAFMDRENP